MDGSSLQLNYDSWHPPMTREGRARPKEISAPSCWAQLIHPLGSAGGRRNSGMEETFIIS